MAGPWFNGLLGRLLKDGVEQALRGGINFQGFTWTPLNDALGRPVAWTLSIPPSAISGLTGFRDLLAAGAAGDGTTSDAAAMQDTLNAAAAKCETVYLPPTAAGYLFDAPLAVPDGVRVLGAFSGLREGLPSMGLSSRGSAVIRPSSFRGKLFTLGKGSSIQGIEVFDRDQKTSGTPDIYDWTFYIPSGAHWASIIDCAIPNAYRGIYCAANGVTVHNVGGWCLSEGVHLGRVGDVARITNVQLNPSAWSAGAGLIAWHNANGFPFTIDGAEEFCFVNCFSYGGLVGLRIQDLDGDGFNGSYGSWVGGGWDSALTGVQIFSGLDARGFRLSNVGIIPSGAGGGVGIKMSDSLGGIAQYQKPKILMNNVSMWQGAGYDRPIWIETNSQATLLWDQGYAYDFTNELLLNQSATARWRLRAVEGKDGVLRINNPGGSPYGEDDGGLPTDPDHVTGTINFGTIGANSNVQGNIAVSWLSGNEAIMASLTGPLPSGISFAGAWCSAGLVWIALANGTGAGIVVGNVDFRVRVSR